MTGLGRAKRRADRAFYRALFRLYRVVLPTNVAPGPVRPTSLRRVLVAPRDAVGDLVMVTPVLNYLRAVVPGARVDVLASNRNASLLVDDPRVDRLIVRKMRGLHWLGTARVLRRERYDLIVNAGHSQHLKQGWFTALVAGRRALRVSVHRPRQYRGFFTHMSRIAGFERRHHVERVLYALQRAVNPAQPPGELERERYPLTLAVQPAAAARANGFLTQALGTDDAPTPSFVAVNCWASLPIRSLDPAQAVAIVAALVVRYPELTFVLTPPPGEEASAAAIVRGVRAEVPALDDGQPGARRLAIAPASPQLADLIALLARATIVLTPDTANVHLAAALGRPVVGLYNSTSSDPFWLHRPFGVPYQIVALPSRRPLRPLRTMPPTAIVAAFDALWTELQGNGAPLAREAVVPLRDLGE